MDVVVAVRHMTQPRTFAAGVATGALLVVAYLGYRYLTFRPESPLQQARRKAYLEGEDA
jgi:putative flippase GtrA